MSDENKSSEVKSFDYFNRMNICGLCEHFKRSLTVSKCNLCGCLLALKAKKSSESCPIGKW